MSSNPERAALIANTYAEVYAELRRDQDLQRNNDAAAVIQETFQEEKWGADREAAAARAVKRLDLAQAARFVELLSEA